ncbi:MAG: endonuclease/exonuclease/phosphatase family protein [Deltaproteobacteria bacterium]|nr:endonuclease/exonuclease/phosphatase family protein [Deltaproteobacteria bacterium]
MPLKVLMLNLWNASGAWPERAKRFREWIDRLDPDLIGFQEAVRQPHFDQVPELLAGRGYQLDYVAASPYWQEGREAEAGDVGNAVASRFPIRERAELRLPAAGDGEKRAALRVGVEAPYGDISFTVTTSTGSSITAGCGSARWCRSATFPPRRPCETAFRLSWLATSTPSPPRRRCATCRACNRSGARASASSMPGARRAARARALPGTTSTRGPGSSASPIAASIMSSRGFRRGAVSGKFSPAVWCATMSGKESGPRITSGSTPSCASSRRQAEAARGCA